MRVAIISDIHANLEALQAVMADAEKKRVDKFYCLGDIIGYGPSPREVLDIVTQISSETVRGNHEELVLKPAPDNIHPSALAAAAWTKKTLQPLRGGKADDARRERWEWLKALPVTEQVGDEGDILLAHGTPEDPFSYVLTQSEAVQVMKKQMGDARVCFIGHSHVPGVFYTDGRRMAFLSPERKKRYSFPDQRYLVNVGSVGQPRDHDPRACYVVLHDDGTFEFRRVEYDIERTAKKIYAIKELPNWLGERLLCGE